MSSALEEKAEPGETFGPSPASNIRKRVIPCLDVDAGRVVKGSNFVDLNDAGDPIELAVRYDEEGADEIVFLDITATSDARDSAVELARRAADNVFVPFTVGGGVRKFDDAQAILDAGADKVAVNSAAVKDPELIEKIRGVLAGEVLVVAIDAKHREADDGWDVYTAGGRINSGRDAVEWAREAEQRGAGEILLTSIDADGTKQGYDLELTEAISNAVGIPVIASGGAGGVQHMVEAFEAGASAVLAASIFHFRELSIGEVKRQLLEAGIDIRPFGAPGKPANT